MVPWSILNWMILLTIFQPAVSVLQYSAVELLQFRFNRYPSPPDLHFYTDISKPRRKYIHRGSRRNYNYDDSNSIKSFWSSSSRSTRKLERTADHSVLAHLGKSTITESTTNVFTLDYLTFVQLTTKRRWFGIYWRIVSLISSVWLRHGSNTMIFLSWICPFLQVLLTLVNSESRVEVVA